MHLKLKGQLPVWNNSNCYKLDVLKLKYCKTIKHYFTILKFHPQKLKANWTASLLIIYNEMKIKSRANAIDVNGSFNLSKLIWFNF